MNRRQIIRTAALSTCALASASRCSASRTQFGTGTRTRKGRRAIGNGLALKKQPDGTNKFCHPAWPTIRKRR